VITIVRGANAPLAAGLLRIRFNWPITAGSLDPSAFLLGAGGTVRRDADMIFYNQTSAEHGAITLLAEAPGSADFMVALPDLPETVEKIVFCLAIDAASKDFRAFDGAEIRIVDAADSCVVFRPVLDDAAETALIVAELYRRAGQWKVRAVGQGFVGGLGPLARSFGVNIADAEAVETAPVGDDVEGVDETPPAETPPVETLPAETPPADAMPFPRTPGAQRLEVGRPPCVLPLDIISGPIHATLHWECRIGGEGGRVRPIVLALGAFYRLKSGVRGVIQAADNRGHLAAPPWTALHGKTRHDRDGGVDSLEIVGDRLSDIERIDLFAYIARGSASWAGCTAWCTVAVAGQVPVELPLGAGPDGAAVVALLSMSVAESALSVAPQLLFANDQADLDKALGWGLTWRFGKAK
jgi:tellurite resistance protein TerA